MGSAFARPPRHAIAPDVAVVMLTMIDDDGSLADALRAGGPVAAAALALIPRKLGVDSREEALAVARDAGLGRG